jgi:hypothetical protein
MPVRIYATIQGATDVYTVYESDDIEVGGRCAALYETVKRSGMSECLALNEREESYSPINRALEDSHRRPPASPQ